MEDIMIILGLVIVGLACIAAVGYILFRPVGGKDPFEAMAQDSPVPEAAEEEIPEDSAEVSKEEPAEEQEETEE